ncbi:MAG: efflux RND transporter permease subunit, partial [Planctomycetota bacterium]
PQSLPLKGEGGFFVHAYTSLLSGLLNARYVVAILAFAAAGAAVYGALSLGRELIPPVDAGQIAINVRMPSGANIDVTDREITRIEEAIIRLAGKPDPQFAYGDEQHADSDVQLLISNIGVLMDWPAAYTPNAGPGDAFMLLQLKGKPGRPGAFAYAEALREQLTAEFPAVEFAFDTGGTLTSAMNRGEPAPLHFQVSGSKLDVMQSIAQTVTAEIEQVEGAVDVRIAQRLDYPTMTIKMDRDLAARVGLTPEDVMKNLVSATNSSVGFDPAFWIDQSKGNHYFIGVQYPERLLTSISTVEEIPVGYRNGRPVRLKNVATIERGEGPGSVSHRNITRVMDVYANAARGYDVGTVMTAIERRLLANQTLQLRRTQENRGEVYRTANKALEGHALRAQGEVKSMRETFRQFATGLAIAAVLVYLVMVAQFQSFLDPLVILLTVPLGFIGVVAVMYGTGTTLSIMSLMGVIMMVGIVVEYAIVLVDFANRRVADGLPVRDAILDAAAVRARPILMASLTTWLALLPMAIASGGADANAPLARTIIGGVLAATVLTLLVTPCLYLIFKHEPATPAAGRVASA